MEHLFSKTAVGILMIALFSAAVMAVTLPLTALQAYVVCDLWRLFMKPWLGIPAPGLWDMAGAIAVVRVMATGMRTSKSQNKNDKDEENSMRSVIRPLIVGLVGVLALWGMGHLFFWLGH